MYHIAKVSIQPIYRDMIQSPKLYYSQLWYSCENVDNYGWSMTSDDFTRNFVNKNINNVLWRHCCAVSLWHHMLHAFRYTNHKNVFSWSLISVASVVKVIISVICPMGFKTSEHVLVTSFLLFLTTLHLLAPPWRSLKKMHKHAHLQDSQEPFTL